MTGYLLVVLVAEIEGLILCIESLVGDVFPLFVRHALLSHPLTVIRESHVSTHIPAIVVRVWIWLAFSQHVVLNAAQDYASHSKNPLDGMRGLYITISPAVPAVAASVLACNKRLHHSEAMQT